MSTNASVAMRVAIDDFLCEEFGDIGRSDSCFVKLFKDALVCAESQAPYECDSPWGDEVSDFLLTQEIVDRYSTLCCLSRGSSNDMEHAQTLLQVVPSALRVACQETELGPKSFRVVQFFVTMVNCLADDDEDSDDEDSVETHAGEGDENGEEEEKQDDGCVEPENVDEEKKKEQKKNYGSESAMLEKPGKVED